MLPTHEIDGAWLDEDRWWVSDATGMPTTGSPRRQTLETTHHHGRRRSPSTLSAGAYALTVTIEAADYAALFRHIAEVKRILRGRILTLHPSGSLSADSIQAEVEIASELEPVREQFDGGFFADIEATLAIPAGRWYSVHEETVTVDTGRHVLPALIGGSAESSPVITVIGIGATTSVKVTDVESGAWIQLIGNIPSGTAVAIDTDPDVLTATAGVADYSGMLRLGPRPFYLSPSATVDIARNGSQLTTIRARRAFA